MRYKFLCCALFLLALAPAFANAAARNVTPQEAFDMVGKRGSLYLLDVRTFGEYQQARLEGARLIPIDQNVKRLSEVPADRPLLVYCAVGSRSAQGVNYLARQGLPEIYNLSGGIYAWAQKGYPILQGAP